MLRKINDMIKKRFLNTKNNRIYLQDKELLETKFAPGSKYSFLFDKTLLTLRILPDSDGCMTVSKRNRGSWINPVIDIRKKDILNAFEDCDFIEVKIFEDEILITGIVESNDNSNLSQINIATSNIIDIRSSTEIKKSIKIRKNQFDILFKKASGDNCLPNQLDLFEYYSNLSNDFEKQYIQSHLDTSTKFKDDFLEAIKVASFCSGAGILDKGFKDCGFNIVYGVEIEKDMVETYRHNIGEHIIHNDLNNINPDDVPDVPVIITGSPCQDFSNANRVTGKILDSEKNLLIRKIISIAKNMNNLKVLCIENVPQILTKGKKFVDEIKEALSDFIITVNKVNSYDFGSAQKRERAIIICSKIGEINLIPPKLKLFKTVKDAFKGLNDSINNQLDYTQPKPETIEKMKYIPQGGNFKNIPSELRGKGTHSNSYKRLSYNEPSITIANVRKSNILHPEYNRILSVRECARLFDVPDDFLFMGSLSSKQQMIANAVPLKLSTALANAVKQAFINVGYLKSSF